MSYIEAVNESSLWNKKRNFLCSCRTYFFAFLTHNLIKTKRIQYHKDPKCSMHARTCFFLIIKCALFIVLYTHEMKSSGSMPKLTNRMNRIWMLWTLMLFINLTDIFPIRDWYPYNEWVKRALGLIAKLSQNLTEPVIFVTTGYRTRYLPATDPRL